MKMPAIRGVIDRRILVNFRADPGVVTRLLPPPFRPKLTYGHAIVGICLIRLRDIRPAGLPDWLGISSENAAHRIGVEWEEDGTRREGVYVPRRDTDSQLNTLAGGRLFPGVQHHAYFTVRETDTHLEVALRSDDGSTEVSVVADVAPALPAGSVFGSLDEVSAFFEAGAVGYSATDDPGRSEGMELRCRRWEVSPLAVQSVRSSFFEDRERFPEGSVQFDNALLMRGIEHEWLARQDLREGDFTVKR